MCFCVLSIGCGGDDGDDVSNGSSINPVRGNLISKVEISKGKTITSSSQIIKFIYDDKKRVIAADYSGEEYVCGPIGARVHFNVSGNTLKLTFSKVGSDVGMNQGYQREGYGEGVLNSMGVLTESYIYATSNEIQRGDYSVETYEHNEKGQITAYLIDGRKRATYTWANDCLTNLTGNPGGAGYPETIGYTTYENKANLDLNWLIFD